MKIFKAYLGFSLGIISLLLVQVFRLFPGILESFYTNFVYRAIRWVYSITLTYIPFPLLYIFIILIIGIFVRRLFVRKKSKWFRLILNFAGWIVFMFYWSWGYNYFRTPFHERAALSITEPTPEFLYAELNEVDSILQLVRSEISENDTIALTDVFEGMLLQEKVRQSQLKVLQSLGQPTFANPRIRELKPKGSLLRIKTAGVYFPFVFEGHIDDGLHPIEKPYVMAHEMAHAYAITDEGVCNFIGFMTCANSDDPFIAYSGWLEYQGYLYRALRRNFPDVLKDNNYQLPEVVKTDLRAIRERLDKYPNIAPKFRDFFYNNYLKSQGVSDGMKSYAQITRLAFSYKKRKGSYYISE